MSPDTCVICKQSTREITREHVWPRWFLRQMDKTAPPLQPWSAKGELLLDRDQKPIHPQLRTRVLIPVCGPCNGAMNITVEAPAQTPVLRLATNGWAGAASHQEWTSIGLENQSTNSPAANSLPT